MAESPARLTAEQAQALAAAVSSVRGVARLDGGAFGSIASYYPGERIVGLRQKDGRLQISIALDSGFKGNLHDLAAAIRAAAAPFSGAGLPVDVNFVDIEEDSAE